MRGAVSVAGVLMWLFAAACQSAAPVSTTQPAEPQPTATPAEMIQPIPPAQTKTPLSDDPTLGPATAPITIVEYSDFGCSACKTWNDAGILKQIQLEYGDKVLFVWRDYAVQSSQSRAAAEAARCAFDQGKFWEYHDVLFAHQPAFGSSDLKAYAAQLGLDTAQFNHCLDTGQHFDQVARGLKDGMYHGFYSAPSFLVNDTVLPDSPPFELFQKTIDAILSDRL